MSLETLSEHDSSRLVFHRLRPVCVTLSHITLSKPTEALPALLSLKDALSAVDPQAVSQGLGNYIFFPLRTLLRPETSESLLSNVFDIITWLLSSAWYVNSEEMSSQLVILLSTSLSKARSEELVFALIRALDKLFEKAGSNLVHLAVRPSLAHLITLLLDIRDAPQNQIASLNALVKLYGDLDGHTAASFLPGTVSSLSRVMVKVNQKTKVIVASLRILEVAIPACLNGSTTAYRTQAWRDATNSQLHLALGPVLSQLLKMDNTTIQDEALKFCRKMVTPPTFSSKAWKRICIDYMLQISPAVLSDANVNVSDIEDLVSDYVLASVGILQGADEQRKINMLRTLHGTFPMISQGLRPVLSMRFVELILGFIKFTNRTARVTTITASDEPPAEPMIEGLSADTRDALAQVLGVCDQGISLELDRPESFWVAQRLKQDTYAHAACIWKFSDGLMRDLAFQSIIVEAQTLGVKYRVELSQILYELLVLPQQSLYTLQAISTACEYQDLQQMMIENSNHIVNGLTIGALNLRQGPVFELVLKLAPHIVEYVDDVVNSFLKYLDYFHGEEQIVKAMFHGLAAYVTAAAAKQPVESQFLAAIEHQAPTVSADESSFEDEFEDDQVNGSSARKIPDAPHDLESKSYRAVLKVLEKAQLFLSHYNNDIKIHILGVINTGIPVIATNENKFLPLVHLMWPQLMLRLSDNSPYVVAAVLEVVARLITFAGSFMRMRINEDIVPFISEILHPAKDKRGNFIHARRTREGSGRRKVAASIELLLASVVENGGLRDDERMKVLEFVDELSAKSVVLQRILHNARNDEHTDL